MFKTKAVRDMIMSYKSISSNTINRQQTGGIIMTELSRFSKKM